MASYYQTGAAAVKLATNLMQNNQKNSENNTLQTLINHETEVIKSKTPEGHKPSGKWIETILPYDDIRNKYSKWRVISIIIGILTCLLMFWSPIITIVFFNIHKKKRIQSDVDYFCQNAESQKFTESGHPENEEFYNHLRKFKHSVFIISLFFFPFYLIAKKCCETSVTRFYESSKFRNLRDGILESTEECNKMNYYVQDKFKKISIASSNSSLGKSQYVDKSNYNFAHQYDSTEDYKNENIHMCSLSVLKNSRSKPFVYLCKYFDIDKNEETLERFNQLLNDACTAEQGLDLLLAQRSEILKDVYFEIPFIARRFYMQKTMEKLGFEIINLDIPYPEFVFKYVSAAGNSMQENRILLDTAQLEDFIKYLDDTLKKRKSAEGQRALMTAKLREEIKARDSYTCQNCGNSIKNEPNLLLEIDHIIPISKGGMTQTENLQTLCWRCNRSKGSKSQEEWQGQ